jgi:putative ABC transport system permease protein
VTTAGSALAGNLLIGQLGERSISVGVLIVSPRQYAAVVAGTPWPAFPATSLERPGPGGPVPGGTVPAIASPQVAAAMRGGASELAFGSGQLTLYLAGTAASTPALPAGGPFVLIPSWAAARLPGAPPAGILLATGTGIDGRALSAAVARTQPGGQVLLRSAVLGSITGAPLRLGSVLIFELCIAAAVAFSVAALLLGLAHAGRDRARLSARLAALGTTRRQRSGIAVLEALPLVTIALAGGVTASLILAPLVGPGLDLASFTGSAAAVPLRPELAGLLGPALGLLLLVCVTAAGTAVVARSRGAGRSLRQDEGR